MKNRDKYINFFAGLLIFFDMTIYFFSNDIVYARFLTVIALILLFRKELFAKLFKDK